MKRTRDRFLHMSCITVLQKRAKACSSSSIHWLRCSFSIQWERKEVCLANLGFLSQYPLVVEDEDMQTLEKFVDMMYDRSSTFGNFNERAWKQKLYKAIPPTWEALKQDMKRAAYLESVNSKSTRNTDSFQLGMEQERRSVADRLTELPPIAESCQQLTSQNALVDVNATYLV